MFMKAHLSDLGVDDLGLNIESCLNHQHKMLK